jgi:hypothetical protein
MALGSVSQLGGPQVELELEVMLHQGNWWIFVNRQPAGYYPTTLFQGGPLTTGANEIDFGGETLGDGSYPPMGSGQFASRGDKYAAYQRNIFHTAANGAASYANLTPSQGWPNSYTINVGTSPEWGENFYFGGPGSGTSQLDAMRTFSATASGNLIMRAPGGITLEGLSVADAATVLEHLRQG